MPTNAATTNRNSLKKIRKLYPQVRTISNAKRPVSFEVTESDSKKSLKKSPNKCALATACERQYDGAIIYVSTAYLIKGTRATKYQVGSRIAREIVSFDRHQDFAPGVYTLNVVSPSLWKPAQRTKKPGANGPQRVMHRTAGIRRA